MWSRRPASAVLASQDDDTVVAGVSEEVPLLCSEGQHCHEQSPGNISVRRVQGAVRSRGSCRAWQEAVGRGRQVLRGSEHQFWGVHGAGLEDVAGKSQHVAQWRRQCRGQRDSPGGFQKAWL